MRFQPNSIQGKKLLDKCSHLLEENSEIARHLGEERMQVMRIQLTAERTKRVQLRQRIAEFDRHAEQIDAENERMQKKIADLGSSLKETRAEIDRNKKDIEDFRSSGSKRKRPDGEKEPAAEGPAGLAPSVPALAVVLKAAQPLVPSPVDQSAPLEGDASGRHKDKKKRHKEKKEKQ
ncbi:unnamed protein product [Polarella glacialis]|uniref:Uncharacterized protein n=1 Tax=Polarella glacialis TaxID=89957 RepID=A0A813HSV5_POLGL|nr:unnamed protein product [Polarella glacialis]